MTGLPTSGPPSSGPLPPGPPSPPSADRPVGGVAGVAQRWRSTSLRARLLVVLVAVLAVGLVASDGLTFVELRGYLAGQVDQQLQSVSFPAVARTVFACATSSVNGRCQVPLDSTTLPAGDLAQLQLPSQPAFSTTFGGPTKPFPALPPVLPSTEFSASAVGGARYRLLAQPVTIDHFAATLVVAVPLAGVQHDLGRLLLIEALVSAAALAGLGVASWWLVRRGLRPLRSMAATAGAIAAGDLSQRVAASDDRTEVGQLGRALNTMLGEIETAFAARAASEEQLRRFLADASHELRTPLTSIRGYAEMFDRGVRDRPEDLAVAMRHIRSEADRMGLLVEDLLLLARLGQPRPIAWEPVDLAMVAAESAAAARAANPGRLVEVSAPATAPVPGDAGRLRQVVDNLVRNALAYSPPEQPVEVVVAPVHSAAGAPDGVALTVADRGPGIGPTDRERIFQPFQRLDPSRTRATGGMGLGLAIVAAIVRAHGGRVWVEERPGGGSAFRVLLVPGGPVGAPSAGARGTGVPATVAGYGPVQAAAPEARRRHDEGSTMASHADRQHLDEGTRATEREEALAAHGADRPPTPEEGAAAPEGVDESVSAHEREMARRGATVEGEGAV